MFLGLTIWRGASGRAYCFRVLPLRQKFKPIPGGYVLTQRSKVRTWEALYVGHCSNLQQCLETERSAHAGYRLAKAFGMTHIALLASTENDLAAVARDLAKELRPIFNPY